MEIVTKKVKYIVRDAQGNSELLYDALAKLEVSQRIFRTKFKDKQGFKTEIRLENTELYLKREQDYQIILTGNLEKGHIEIVSDEGKVKISLNIIEITRKKNQIMVVYKIIDVEAESYFKILIEWSDSYE